VERENGSQKYIGKSSSRYKGACIRYIKNGEIYCAFVRSAINLSKNSLIDETYQKAFSLPSRLPV